MALRKEVIPAEDPFDPEAYDALLRIDLATLRVTFPEICEGL